MILHFCHIDLYTSPAYLDRSQFDLYQYQLAIHSEQSNSVSNLKTQRIPKWNITN